MAFQRTVQKSYAALLNVVPFIRLTDAVALCGGIEGTLTSKHLLHSFPFYSLNLKRKEAEGEEEKREQENWKVGYGTEDILLLHTVFFFSAALFFFKFREWKEWRK